MKQFFRKRYLGVPLWWFLPVMGVALIALLIGTFFDKEISTMVVKQKGWLGMFFESYGMIPTGMLGAISFGAIAKGLSQFEGKKFKAFAIIAAVTGIALFGYLMADHISDPYSLTPNLNKVAAFFVGAAICAGVEALCYFVLYKNAPKNVLIIVGAIALLSLGVSFGVNEILKHVAYRPRFRYLAGLTYNADGVYGHSPLDISYYRAWYEGWQWFSYQKYRDLDPLIVKDCVKSFPSGHTCYACLFLSLPYLVYPCVSEEKRAKAMTAAYIAGVIYIGLVAVARVEVGAHYVSDVSFAILEGSVAALAMFLLGEKFTKRFLTE